MRRILALVVWGACYSPHPQPGAACGSGGGCPEGLVCSPATMTCELQAIDAATAMPDAPADARVDALRVDAPLPGPHLLQQKTNTADAATTLSATLPNLPASGDLLVMVGGNQAGTLTSVTGGGATWTLAAQSTANANVEIYVGVSDGTSATVTIARTGTASAMTISVSEWSGLVGTAPVDVTSTAFGATSPADAGPIATTHANDLLLFGVRDLSPNTFGAPGPGSWAALDGIAGALTQGTWYRYVTATGTFDPAVTETAGHWDAALVALRAL